jgi:hypothetical protein
MFVALGVLWKIGVMPSKGLRLIWRRDHPESFDAGMALLFVFFGGLAVIGLFGIWAADNSARLTRDADEAARRGQAESATSVAAEPGK